MRMRPLVGSISRLTIFSEVVLPQPDGPTRTQILPAGIVSDRSFTAPAPLRTAAASYDLVTCSYSTVAAWPDWAVWAVIRASSRTESER